MLEAIKNQTADIVAELLAVAKLQPGDLFVVGCSTSEVMGQKIGTASSAEAASAIFEGLSPLLREKDIFLAAQCCEHLNRALIVERDALRLYGLEEVNVVPLRGAGGSFATLCYHKFENAVAVDTLGAKAKAGVDIGGTLIGMHLQRVCVPVRVSSPKIGEANVLCARVRPRFVGGSRAVYNETLL